jgi:uncharacterized membrane protein
MTTRITALKTAPRYDDAPVYMDAELRPNRSLSVHGFRIVMLSMAAMSFVAGLGFLSIGAWPVFGFFGLDVVLVYLAFKLNFKAGERERETIRVTAKDVAISRTCYRGHIGWWHVSPAFARVHVEPPCISPLGVPAYPSRRACPLTNGLPSPMRSKRPLSARATNAIHHHKRFKPIRTS